MSWIDFTTQFIQENEGLQFRCLNSLSSTFAISSRQSPFPQFGPAKVTNDKECAVYYVMSLKLSEDRFAGRSGWLAGISFQFNN
jgi:hypothetical protein